RTEWSLLQQRLLLVSTASLLSLFTRCTECVQMQSRLKRGPSSLTRSVALSFCSLCLGNRCPSDTE
ncbi:hypothetical protein PENTCL1PPCAC_25870, partial [Pristionchus entomophagus]